MIMRILGIFTFARRIASHLKQSQPRLELISYSSLTTTWLNLCQGTHFNFMYNLTWTWHLGKIPHILQRWYCGLSLYHKTHLQLCLLLFLLWTIWILEGAVDRDDRSHKMNTGVERTPLFCHVILPGRSLQGTFPYPLLLWYEHIILTSLLTHQKA